MLRKAGSTFALILGLALTVQSALAVDHIHLEQGSDYDTCLVCHTYTPGDAVTDGASCDFPPAAQIQNRAPDVSATFQPRPRATARAPPVSR